MLDAIPILHTSNFIVSDPTKFRFVGSIPTAMLSNVPADNIVVNKYQKKHVFGIRPVPEDLRKELEVVNKPKKEGKRKGKVGPFEPA